MDMHLPGPGPGPGPGHGHGHGHGHRQNTCGLLRGIISVIVPSPACYRPYPRRHGQGVMQRAGLQLRHVVPHLR